MIRLGKAPKRRFSDKPRYRKNWRSSTRNQLSGTFAVYKPKHVTSYDVVSDIRHLLTGSRNLTKRFPLKVGHGGTLDKAAEGVLVIGVGNDTTQLSKIMQADKEYIASGSFGTATASFDEDSEVTHTSSFEHVNREAIDKVLSEIRGVIMQTPPVYSALKQAGKRMSDRVRSGEKIEPKPARPVMINSVRCLSFDPPNFSIHVSCGPGVYVRTIVHELGLAVGTHAHVTTLCRTASHGFSAPIDTFQRFSAEEFHVPDKRETWTLKELTKEKVMTLVTPTTPHDERAWGA